MKFKRKFMVFFVLFVLSAMLIFSKVNKVFCLEFSSDSGPKICYGSALINFKENAAKKAYSDFVSSVKWEPQRLKSLTFFDEELKASYRGKIVESLIKTYSWVELEHIIDIVSIDEMSLVLLEKSDKDRYVLYFDHDMDKFFFSYDRKIEYFPITEGWVNNDYGAFYSRKTSFDLSGVFGSEEGGDCNFRKGNIFAEGTLVLDSDDSSDPICEFGQYRIYLSAKDSTTEVIDTKRPPQSRIFDRTSQFLEWLSLKKEQE